MCVVSDDIYAGFLNADFRRFLYSAGHEVYL